MKNDGLRIKEENEEKIPHRPAARVSPSHCSSRLFLCTSSWLIVIPIPPVYTPTDRAKPETGEGRGHREPG